MSFGELDTAFSEASYLVNCRPLQLNPTTGDDSYICPNDLLMGRSDKAPVYDVFLDSNLTRRLAHIQKLKKQFWDKWSSSYYQTLVKYHRWRLADRNAQVNDVVLILDKEIHKGKFSLGLIDSVKVDSDGLVRKCTVKYKLPYEGNTVDLQPQRYKYTERNVRGLALIVTAEERASNETIDIDASRPDVDESNHSNDEEDYQDTSENQSTNDAIDDEDSSQVNPDPNDENQVTINTNEQNEDSDKQVLPPTSSGRKRFKKKILDL